jgi:hypothetical protein
VAVRGRDVPLASAFIQFDPKQNVKIEESSQIGADWEMYFKEPGPGVITFLSRNKADLENILKYIRNVNQAQWAIQMDGKIAEFEAERAKAKPDVAKLKSIAFSMRCGLERLKNWESRYYLLKAISKEWRIDGFDETIAIDVIKTADKAQSVQLINKLNVETTVLADLDYGIDDEEYIEYHKALQGMFTRAIDIEKVKADHAAILKDHRTPLLANGDFKFMEELANKGIIVWSDPGLIKFVAQTDFSAIDYESVKIENGKMSFHVDQVRWFGQDYDFDVKGKSRPFDPLCIFVVTSTQDLFNPNNDTQSVFRGTTFYLPAVSMLMLDNVKTKNEVMRYVDAATAVIPVGLGAKAGRWGFVALETGLFIVQNVMNDYAMELSATPEGRAVLRAWMIVSVVYAVADMSGGIDDMKRAIQNLKVRIKKLPSSKAKTQIETEVNQLENTVNTSDVAPPVTTTTAPRANLPSVADKVTPKKNGFRFNRKNIQGMEKMVGDPESVELLDAGREAYAAELIAKRSNVDKVYVGKEADRFINKGAKGTSADIVGVTNNNQLILSEAKGKNIDHAITQLKASAEKLGKERVVRFEMVLPEEVQRGYRVAADNTLEVVDANGKFSTFKIHNKSVYVTFTAGQ